MANSKIGDTDVLKCYLGDNLISNSFLGDLVVCNYQPSPQFSADFVASQSVQIATGANFEWSDDNGVTWTSELAGVWSPTAGTYKMRKTDGYLNVRFGNETTTSGPGFTSITNIISIGATDVYRMFYYCSNLTDIDLSGISELAATDATEMFSNCTSLTSIVGTSLFTSITNGTYMFRSCEAITQIDTSGLSGIVNANSMFYRTLALPNIDALVFTNVTDATYMFYQSGITTIDTGGFTAALDATRMFNQCSSLESVTDSLGTGFQNIINANTMFYDTASLICISRVNTTNATDKTSMFYNPPALVNPTSAEQTSLMSTSGLNYVNANSCP